MAESEFGPVITSNVNFGDLIKFRCLKNPLFKCFFNPLLFLDSIIQN